MTMMVMMMTVRIVTMARREQKEAGCGRGGLFEYARYFL